MKLIIVFLICQSILLTLPNQSSATEYDAATKTAIESLNKQINDKEAEIKNRNFPKGICEPDYPPITAAIAEKNRLNKYYPYKLKDANGNTYSPEDLSVKLGEPWIEVTDDQMRAAEAAIVAARQPCEEYSLLANQKADLQSQLNELIMKADLSDPRLRKCDERMPKIQFEIGRLNDYLRERTQFWNSSTEVIDYIDYYSVNVNVTRKQSLDIMYSKSLDEMNNKQTVLESFFKPNFESSETSIKGCDSVKLISPTASKLIAEAEALLKQIVSLKSLINQKYKFYSSQFQPSSFSGRAGTKKTVVRMIICSKGKLLKKISGSNPKCPVGYTLKK